ncbi:MAG TPA: acetate kinase [Chloroflexia bacterium]|jgi:acetate kinase
MVLNNGSSSVKFDLIDLSGTNGPPSARTLAHGQIDLLGHEATLPAGASPEAGRGTLRRSAGARDREQAIGQAIDAISEVVIPGTGSTGAPVQAVGHRVVHGGDRFVAPVLVDDSVLSALEGLEELAPLHNPAAVEGIRVAREALGPEVPMVAVFDTAFHATMPEHAYTYALPHDMAQRKPDVKQSLRRYGFHGTAHEYMLKRYSESLGIPTYEATIITLQLGNGCSATAIRDGRSVDTSMGFTPLEGLVMGTRSGDIDPSIVGYLVRKEGISAEEVEHLLNERSGLLGISGRSADMRDLLAAAPHDPQAQLAIDIFCYRARKYIGAYLAAMGGAQAIVFGGGIGENAPAIRAGICEGLEWCGLRLDAPRNAATVGAEGRISVDEAPIAAHVVTVNEAILIAMHTAECIRLSSAGP